MKIALTEDIKVHTGYFNDVDCNLKLIISPWIVDILFSSSH